MRAIGYTKTLPIADDQSLVDLTLPDPTPGPQDLVVAVEAVSVNPVDVKVRARAQPEHGPRILGFDAAGVVVAAGEQTRLFKTGDRVFYAGAIDRPGADSQLHVVDERIVGPMPRSLDFAQAAALPLTAITAWEALFDRLDVRRPVPGAAAAILIVGGAGGVASIAIQLARKLTDLTVIATASRPESRDFVEEMGAHSVVDHAQPLAPQVEALGLGAPAFVFSTNRSEDHAPGIAELIAPQGRFALIDDPATLDINPFKRKSASIHWEFMFTRSMFKTADIEAQHRLLSEVGKLVDAGVLRTTLTTRLGPISAATLREAHRLVEAGSMIGKVVVADWK